MIDSRCRPRPSVQQTDRATLKRMLAEAAECQHRIDTMHDSIHAAEHAIDAAVEEHGQKTADLRAAMATADAAERERLTGLIDLQNIELDTTCRTMRARITRLQSDLMIELGQLRQAGPIESELQSSASPELADTHWHITEDLKSAEARKSVARKTAEGLAKQLAFARVRGDRDEIARLEVDSRRWEAEHVHLVGLVEKLIGEQSEIRQRMLEE